MVSICSVCATERRSKPCTIFALKALRFNAKGIFCFFLTSFHTTPGVAFGTG